MFDNKKIVFSVVILFGAYFVDYYFIHNGENTTLDMSNGKLKGKVSFSRGGREFYEFLGISMNGFFTFNYTYTNWCMNYRNSLRRRTCGKITIFGNMRI